MASCCLDRKEIPCATWRMHSTRLVLSVETQDGFFCHLAGWSAMTGLANVHWVGYTINLFNFKFNFKFNLCIKFANSSFYLAVYLHCQMQEPFKNRQYIKRIIQFQQHNVLYYWLYYSMYTSNK